MSDRDRSGQFATIALAIVVIPLILIGVWQISAKYALDTKDADRAARQYSQDADEHIRRTCVTTDVTLMAKCVKQVVEVTEESKRAVYDLKAQQQMADWTFWMLLASVAATIVTAIGVWFVRDTLVETRKAVEATVQATAATVKATEDQQRIGEAQVRAYLTCLGAEYTFEDDMLSVRPKFKNTGQSPADSDVKCNTVCGCDIRLSSNRKTMLPCQDIDTSTGLKEIGLPN